jgi:hypothetical protein
MTTPVKHTTQVVDEHDMYLYRERYQQRRPFDLVLPYACQAARMLKRGVYGNPNLDPGREVDAHICFSEPTPLWDDSTRVEQAKSLAYSKLLGKISDRASMGENIGQLAEATELLVQSFNNLRNGVKSLRQRDPVAFGKWLLEGSKSHKEHFFNPVKKIASGVLILDFVVLPTLEDIYSAINVLQSPIKDVRVRGRAFVDKNLVFDTGAAGSRWVTETGKVFAEYGASLKVDNPNLWLANTMGVVNPAQIAWQLLPGSFLFDWLIPIEQTLGMMTDFLGLEVSSSYTTSTIRTTRTEGFSPGFYQGQTALFSRLDMVRTPGIVLPSLRFRPLKVPGMRRAANAAALAIQAFGPGKSKLSSTVGIKEG